MNRIDLGIPDGALYNFWKDMLMTVLEEFPSEEKMYVFEVAFGVKNPFWYNEVRVELKSDLKSKFDG